MDEGGTNIPFGNQNCDIESRGYVLRGKASDAFRARSPIIGVYVHCKPCGTVFYVGKGTPARARAMSQRRKRHLSVVSKYALENIKIIFMPCVSEDEAFKTEIRLIAHYRANGVKLLNLTDGGEGASGFKIPLDVVESRRLKLLGKPKSEAHRKKLRDALLGRKMPLEHRQKHRAAMSRAAVRAKIKASALGRKHSVSAREKNRIASLGRKLSAEARAKISAFHKGRQHSKEQIAKNAAALRGRKNSPEVLAKKRASKAIRILITCKLCGKEALRFPDYSMYCGDKCKHRAYRLRKKKHGVKHPSDTSRRRIPSGTHAFMGKLACPNRYKWQGKSSRNANVPTMEMGIVL